MPRGTANYFSVDKMEKECGDCGEIKKISRISNDSEFHHKTDGLTAVTDSELRPSDFRSMCKICRNGKTVAWQLETKMEAFPKSKWQCDNDDCCRINPVAIENCRKCGFPKK